MWSIINGYLKSVAMLFGYNILYFFSYCQIKYNQMYNIKLINDIKHEEIYGESYNYLGGIKNINLSEYKNKCHDCLIITKHTPINSYDNIIIQKGSDIPKELTWDHVKYKFISLVVVISECETYDIHLNSKTSNYYIVGNVIDKNFINYYLEKYYKIKLPKDKLYTVQLIDQNIKIIILDMDSKLILSKNDYIIMNKDIK